MVTPLAARIVAAMVGGLLVLTSVSNVTGTCPHWLRLTLDVN